MNKKTWSAFLAIILLITGTNQTVFAAPVDIYVSPTGNDANACTATAPCKTIQKGINLVQPGGILYILEGIYSESIIVSKAGTPTAPIRILGRGAVLSNGGSGAFIVHNSRWVTFEGLSIKGYTLMDFEIRQSHYLTFRNNVLEYTFTAVRIKDGASHILIENNEIYQTYPAGSTWSSLKGSKYEGAGVYASTGGQGMYFIRGNYFHDSMNGIYFSDSDAGNWMNANVFINGNTFRNIVDDPFEPEGDSFNIHFYNNTLINTHRMASIVPDSACVGPIFIYGNYQNNTLDPTREANTGRRNSIIKMDMSAGTCSNGVWVFNNTANANATTTNFYGVDLITSSVRNYSMLNNVLVTEKNAYSGSPVFTNALSDYNISLKPFGYMEPNGLQANPLLNLNGTLQPNSPAKGRGTSIAIPNYFGASQIVPARADLGAFRSFPSPIYVLPPGGEPANFPANVAGWPDASASAITTPSLVPKLATASPSFTATSTTLTGTPTQAATQDLTSTNIPVISTRTSASPTSTATTLPTFTMTPIPPSATFTAPPAISAKNEIVYDDDNPALIYSTGWQDISKPKAYEFSHKSTNTVNSFVIINFTGTSFSTVYTTGRNFGNVEIYIDKQLVATLNQYNSQNKFQKRWDYPGLLPVGAHELKLVFVGPPNSMGSIDAVIVR